MTDARKPDRKKDQKSDQRSQTANPSNKDHDQQSGGSKSGEKKSGSGDRWAPVPAWYNPSRNVFFILMLVDHQSPE
jgi:hypothetical protein